MLEKRTRRGKISLSEVLGDNLDGSSIEIIHTLRFPSVIRESDNESSLTREVRTYFSAISEPILASLDGRLLTNLIRDFTSRNVKMLQPVRQAFALVNHEYHDAMFLGGINTRDLVENPMREPHTTWLMYPDEYQDYISQDPDIFFRALCIRVGGIIPPKA